MSEQGPSDEWLMQATRDGNLEAFERLVLRHQRGAWRVAYGYIQDAAEAEDVVQKAFLRILEAADRYTPSATFRTYLYRIITRLCIDLTRKLRPVYTDRLPPYPCDGFSQVERLQRTKRELPFNRPLQNYPQCITQSLYCAISRGSAEKKSPTFLT